MENSATLKSNKKPESSNSDGSSSQHPSVIYVDQKNPNFKFRLPRIPNETSDIYQNTLHSFFSQAQTPKQLGFGKSKGRKTTAVTQLSEGLKEQDQVLEDKAEDEVDEDFEEATIEDNEEGE